MPDNSIEPVHAKPGAKTVEDLFQTAVLILGNQDEAVAAFEKAVATTEFDVSSEPATVYHHAHDVLTQLAIDRAVALDPAAFEPEALALANDVCLDTEDWEATGVNARQLSHIVSTSGRSSLRNWLEHLRPASRVVFVLRAILGKDSPAVAEALRHASKGSSWTSEQVGQVFRGALCSLATSLVQAPAAI